MSIQNKMMSMHKKTVRELRSIAKACRLRGYSKLRKHELILFISFFDPVVGGVNNMIESPAPDIQTPPLLPSKYSPLLQKSAFKNVLGEVKNLMTGLKKSIRSEVNSFSDWIVSYIPPETKKAVNEKVEVLKTTVSNIFNNITKNTFKIKETNSAIKGFTKQYTVDGRVGTDPLSFLNAVQPHVAKLLSQNPQTKVNFVLTCAMERIEMKTGEVTAIDVPFLSKNEIILDSTDVNEVCSRAKDKMLESIAVFQMRGSNWRFKSVLKFNINTAVYRPLKGNSYIPLPLKLAHTKAIINIKNDDDECFKWAITRAIYPTEIHPERITPTLRKQAEILDWRGIEFPAVLDERRIHCFEINNNISVNIFGYESSIFPLYLSKQNSSDSIIDLLLISDGVKQHYCLIKNFNRLLSLRTEKSHNAMHYCRRCLIGY